MEGSAADRPSITSDDNVSMSFSNCEASNSFDFGEAFAVWANTVEPATAMRRMNKNADLVFFK